MTDYAGYNTGPLSTSTETLLGGDDRLYPSGLSATSQKGGVITNSLVDLLRVPAYGPYQAGTITDTLPRATWPGYLAEGVNLDWFEKVHVLPRSIAFGNILSTVVENVELYNAYRHVSRILESVINNLGEGTNLLGLPTLPATLNPQQGLALTLQALPDGVASFDDFIIFEFDTGIVSLPASGKRIVMFPFRPEQPLVERLVFKTDIFPHRNGTEQRVAARKYPRQEFDMTLYREEGPERQRLEYLLFDWQARVFGVPVWHEPSVLTVAATIGQFSITVDTTNYADLRVGGLAILFTDEITFEALEIESVGTSTITFTSPLSSNWAVGTEVFPIRTAIMADVVSSQRHPVNLGRYTVNLRVLDNTVDLSSTAAFNTYNSKVLLDDINFVDDTVPETNERRVFLFDGETGKFSQDSPWAVSRRGSAKKFVTRTRQKLWEVRQLLHALKGRQISFYLPTFGQDLTLTADLQSGLTSMSVVNVGYARYAQERQPKNVIRVVLKSGTTYTRIVVDASETNPEVESLTVDSAWPTNIAKADVDRIEFLEKVRCDVDEITFRHLSALGEAEIAFPTKVVLE